jgi:hypothetical protein
MYHRICPKANTNHHLDMLLDKYIRKLDSKTATILSSTKKWGTHDKFTHNAASLSLKF